MSDEVLPMQLVYKGKTNSSLPAVEFPAGSLLIYSKKTLEQRKGNTKSDPEHHLSIHQRCEKKVGAPCFTKIFAFSEYFTDCITRELLKYPAKDGDATTTDVNLKLSTLKPKHGKVMCTDKQISEIREKKSILSGWKAVDIRMTIKRGSPWSTFSTHF